MTVPGVLTAAHRFADRHWSGLVGEALAVAVLDEARSRPGTSLVVVDGADRADRLARALKWLARSDEVVGRWADDETRPYDGFSPDGSAARARLAALARHDAGKWALWVATPRSLLQRVPDRDARAAGSRFLAAGDELERDVWLRAQSDAGWTVTTRCDAPGRVAVRGDVIDVWPEGAAGPVRIDLFDDVVESLHRVDPRTGKVVARVRRVSIGPAREERFDKEALARFDRVTAAEVASQARGVQLRRRWLDDLNSGIRPSGLEELLPAFVEVVDVLDALAGAAVRVVLPAEVDAALFDFGADVQRRFLDLDPEERPLVPPSSRYAVSRDVVRRLADCAQVLAVSAEGAHVDFGTVAPESVVGRGRDFVALAAAVRGWVDDDHAVVLAVDDASAGDRLATLFEGHEITVRPATSIETAPRAAVSWTFGDVASGFLCGRSGLAVLPMGRWLGSRPARQRSTKALDDVVGEPGQFADGDRVVHRVHGIGSWAGLMRLDVGSFAQDFGRVIYRGGEILFLPVHALDQVARWAGVGEGAEVELDKLGGATWAVRRGKVRDALLGYADELIRRQAARQLATREPRPAPGPLLRAFEASFPYVETPDQLTAIEAVLDDLSSAVPMDRLVCGDVGFGKTEVAMRAVARVVECGDQALVVCPTTVLAHQHARTFRQRFEGLGVRIAMWSRFVSPAEVRATRDALAAGTVDVVIGTHALLGREVAPRRLGLVVVDEEHRFGVKQKERLRALRVGVDVLAMSATPIPRTMQMALDGVRDLSVIATAPKDRLAVRTRVAPLTPEVIREVAETEVARGGQVFIVHNRIEDLLPFVQDVREALPSVRLGVAHGQMEDDALERVLVDVVEGRVDVLVCTSIIESGVDLPNVNTLIVDRADRFGLAQLHQLRGRVGRGGQRAICLLGVPDAMTPDAKRRLRVLSENSELGGGFRIAWADLELRGGGNLLGTAQSGKIDEVGLDTWTELLAETVATARGEAHRQTIEPVIEVPVGAFVPDALVKDVSERLGWYRRLAACTTDSGIDAWLDDFERQVGARPEEVEDLAGMARVKVHARELGIERITMMQVRAVLVLHPEPKRDRVVDDAIAKHPKRFARTGRGLEVRCTPAEGERPLRFLRWVVAQLGATTR